MDIGKVGLIKGDDDGWMDGWMRDSFIDKSW